MIRIDIAPDTSNCENEQGQFISYEKIYFFQKI